MLYPAELFSFHDAVIKLHTGVASIAEWFIIRGAASAKCHSIARLVAFAVRRFNRDASLNPQRPAATKGWIFDDTDRRFKRLLYFFPGFFVMDDQTSCRAMHRFTYNQITRVSIICLFNQAPYFAAGITKPRERAKVFGIT
jgi:hypothetical protein